MVVIENTTLGLWIVSLETLNALSQCVLLCFVF